VPERRSCSILCLDRSRQPQKAWRTAPRDLDRICCFLHERSVSNDNVVHWDGAACKFPPSQNVSVLPEAKCSFANHSKERLRSIMEKLDSSTPVNNFTGGGHFHVATTVPSSYIPRDSYVVTVVLENDSVPSGRNVGLC